MAYIFFSARHASPCCLTDVHVMRHRSVQPIRTHSPLPFLLAVNLHSLPPVGQPSPILAVNFAPPPFGQASLILVVNLHPLPPAGQPSLILVVNLHTLPPVGRLSPILAVNFCPSSCWTSFTHPSGQLPPLLLLDNLSPS